MVRDGLAVLDDAGNDILAEVVARIRIVRVFPEKVDQERSLE